MYISLSRYSYTYTHMPVPKCIHIYMYIYSSIYIYVIGILLFFDSGLGCCQASFACLLHSRRVSDGDQM